MGMFDKELAKITDTVVTESARTRAELAAAFTTSLRGVRLDGALSRPLRANATNFGTAGRLLGWSLRETSGAAPAVIRLHDGDASGDVIAVIPLTAGAGSTHLPAVPGVAFVDPAGLYAEVTGAADGALYLAATDA